MIRFFQTPRSLSLCRFRPAPSLRQPRPCVSLTARSLPVIRLRVNRRDWLNEIKKCKSEDERLALLSSILHF
jgi:hypothetical protein